MAFCLTFGTNEFTSDLAGTQNITAQCRNCGNYSARCITRWPWFTVCFVPILPLSTHKYQEVACPICRFHQDIRDRPDVQNMISGGGNGGQQQQQLGQYPVQGHQGQGQQGGGYYNGGGQGGGKPTYA